MSYEVSWGGTGLAASHNMLVVGFAETPPEPKTHVVEIPGGQDIDLTEALTGHVAYSNRTLTLTLLRPQGTGGDFFEDMRRLMADVHGVRSELELSWEPGYTLVGRAEVTSWEHRGRGGGTVEVEFDCEPWRLKELHTVTVGAVNGTVIECRSGTRPVRPTVRADSPVTIEYEGTSTTVPAGTWTLRDVVFHEGENRLYVLIWQSELATWADLAGVTWASLSGSTWSSLTVETEPDFSGNAQVTVQWREEYL